MRTPDNDKIKPVTIIAAADGSALGNPGPAGWGWYVDDTAWACGGWPHGTNNMGELMAVLDLLQQTAHLDEDLLVYCDSKYVINSLTQWMPGWKRKGWKKSDGKPVLNVELMKALDAAMQGRRVTFEWVKGHAGHELNEEADRLANTAAAAYQAGAVPDGGPGFAGASTAHPDAQVGQTEPEPDLFSDDSVVELVETSLPVRTAIDEVIELERALLSDELRGEDGDLSSLLHPQWQEIGRSGRLWTREEIIAEIAPLDPPVELEVVSAEQVGDAVLLIWRAITPERSTLRSSWWVQTRAGWQQRFHQGTDEA